MFPGNSSSVLHRVCICTRCTQTYVNRTGRPTLNRHASSAAAYLSLISWSPVLHYLTSSFVLYTNRSYAGCVTNGGVVHVNDNHNCKWKIIYEKNQIILQIYLSENILINQSFYVLNKTYTVITIVSTELNAGSNIFIYYSKYVFKSV